jgi:hypothetical protein
MRSIAGILIFACLLTACSDSGNGNTGTSTNGDSNTKRPLPATPQSPGNTYTNVDASPMDMIYYPIDYPKLKMGDSISTPPDARIIYSRPHLQGRHLFTQILKYGEHWRLGANESTELELFRNIQIMDKKINAGRYILYCIPQPDKWTVILNSNIDTWGLQQDTTKDVARFEIPSIKKDTRLEYFTMSFEKTKAGTDLVMAWDDTEARLPMKF